MVNLRIIFALAALNFGHEALAQDEQVPLSHQGLPSDYTCTHPPAKVHLLSKSPLVMYIEDFLSHHERLHLQSLADGHFKHSGVLGAAGASTIHKVRTSQSTSVDRDALVRCIEARALDMQGFELPEMHLEAIQLVKYAPTERYHFHTDWFTDPTQTVASLGGNRLSSFFAYVKADNVTGGGTNFPVLQAPRDERWCDFIDCDDEYDNGVTFRPIEGNAIYWENLLTSGDGDDRTLHAGLPLVSGEKIGMNIWTRQAPLPAHLR
jgi:prolyl 4-hydroxylase